MFEAKIETVSELLQYGNTKGSFNIPIYQREYRWKENDIQRFMDDIKDGLLLGDFKRFIGAVIFVERKDSSSEAPVLDLIDGQQRITTIVLLLVSFYELLKDTGDAENSDKTRDNIVELLVGTSIRKVSEYCEVYPKLIREESDTRETNENYEYNSSIAKILHAIGCDFYFNQTDKEKTYNNNIENRTIRKNKESIKKYIKEILQKEHSSEKIKKYILNNILFTTVIVKNEDYAFDIFESLNSTGEPLTAIETFIPLIIQEEAKENNYKTSVMKKHVDEILLFIRDKDDSQNISTELVLWQSLLFDGEDINSKHLSIQRKHLRNKYKNLSEEKNRLLYVSIFKELVMFVNSDWNSNHFDSSELEKLMLVFLRSTKTKLLIPILTRFKDENDFIHYLKATTAFFVLWRAYSYGTGGIDKAFKGILNEISYLKSKEIINIFEYKKLLKNKLKNKIGENDNEKEYWLLKAKTSPFGRNFKPIGRFILLASQHNSECIYNNNNKKTSLIKNNNTERTKIEWLTYKNFEDSKRLKEIEHISPQTKSEGWDYSIYKNKDTIHFIGNLTLLSRSSNSMKANMSPKQTAIFYKALASGSKKDLEKLVSDNETVFTKSAIKYLNDSYKYEFLNCLDNMDFKTWDEEFIIKRSENIMSQAWDTLYPWLDE